MGTNITQTQNLICRIAVALYGPHNEGPLADALGKHRRTVRRWKSGASAPMPGVWRDLLRVATERGDDIRNIEHVIRIWIQDEAAD